MDTVITTEKNIILLLCYCRQCAESAIESAGGITRGDCEERIFKDSWRHAACWKQTWHKPNPTPRSRVNVFLLDLHPVPAVPLSPVPSRYQSFCVSFYLTISPYLIAVSPQNKQKQTFPLISLSPRSFFPPFLPLIPISRPAPVPLSATWRTAGQSASDRQTYLPSEHLGGRAGGSP